MGRDYGGEYVSAKYFVDDKAVKGRLSFEKTGIRFQALGIQAKQEVFIPYADIRSVWGCFNYGVIPNGIRVKTFDGIKYRFAVKERKGVLKFLKEQVSRIKNAGKEKLNEKDTYKQNSIYSTYEDVDIKKVLEAQKFVKLKEKIKDFIGRATAIAVVLALFFAGYEFFLKDAMFRPRLTWDDAYVQSSYTQEDVHSETLEWFCAACEVYYGAMYSEYVQGWFAGTWYVDEAEEEYMQTVFAEDLTGNGWTITSREEAIEVVETLIKGSDTSLYESYITKLRISGCLEISFDELLKIVKRIGDISDENYYRLLVAHELYQYGKGTDTFKAWDYLRAMQVLQEGYAAGYFSLEESLDNCLAIAKALQWEFDDWDDLYKCYMFGCQMSYTEERNNLVHWNYLSWQDILSRDEEVWPYTLDYDMKLTDNWSDR